MTAFSSFCIFINWLDSVRLILCDANSSLYVTKLVCFSRHFQVYVIPDLPPSTVWATLRASLCLSKLQLCPVCGRPWVLLSSASPCRPRLMTGAGTCPGGNDSHCSDASPWRYRGQYSSWDMHDHALEATWKAASWSLSPLTWSLV